MSLHALPVVLALEPGCLVAMLRRIAADAAQGVPEPEPGTSRCAGKGVL